MKKIITFLTFITLTLYSMSLLAGLTLYGEFIEIVDIKGSASFTDGSSVYTYKSDGSFSLLPLNGISGRTISGIWSRKTGVIYGEWRSINGPTAARRDYRKMKIHIGSSPKLVTKKFNNQEIEVYDFYFLIEEIVKITEEEFNWAKEGVFNQSLKHGTAQSAAP